jgi:hypothetical protein
MKKITLFFMMILSTVSYSQTRGETIDKMNREVNSFLPQDFNNGIVWTKAINEDNLRAVKIYEVSKKGLSIVENNISKTQFIQQLMSIPKKAGYKISQEKRIILVFRYFYKNTLIKEIIINPEDFN